jgi:hypothetical protein
MVINLSRASAEPPTNCPQAMKPPSLSELSSKDLRRRLESF